MPHLLRLTFVFVLAFAASVKAKPNFVFILCDDLGVMDIGVEGSTFYETPHIDDLANRGMRFTQGYATCQVCSPSRASILTGKYPPNHGITTWIGDRSGDEWRRWQLQPNAKVRRQRIRRPPTHGL